MAGDGTDHRRNAEDLLAQLAGLMHQDKLTAELSQARRRRAAARHTIAVRLLTGRPGHAAA